MKIIKLYLEGCSPCMAITKVMEGMDLSGVEVVSIDMSGNEDKWINKYNLENVPTLILEEGEEEVARLEGWISEEDVLDLINRQC